jgi:hypothetical protein
MGKKFGRAEFRTETSARRLKFQKTKWLRCFELAPKKSTREIQARRKKETFLSLLVARIWLEIKLYAVFSS